MFKTLVRVIAVMSLAVASLSVFSGCDGNKPPTTEYQREHNTGVQAARDTSSQPVQATTSPPVSANSSVQTSSQQTNSDKQFEQFLQAVIIMGMQEQQEKQRREQQFRQQQMQPQGHYVPSGKPCEACSGRGQYSYVDQFGNLQLKMCPHCNGNGRKW